MKNFEFQIDDKTFQLGGFGLFFDSQNATAEQPGAFSLTARLPLAGLLTLSHDYLFGWEFDRIPALVISEMDEIEIVFSECSEGELPAGSTRWEDVREAITRSGCVPYTQAMADDLAALVEGVEVDLDEPLNPDQD
jgi:hypothetical protein